MYMILKKYFFFSKKNKQNKYILKYTQDKFIKFMNNAWEVLLGWLKKIIMISKPTKIVYV